MSAYTYYQGGLISGSTYYAKVQPLTTGTWPADAIAGTENGTTGEFAFVVDDAFSYELYFQATGAPLATDTPVGFVGLATTDAASRTASKADTSDIAKKDIQYQYTSAAGATAPDLLVTIADAP